MKNKIKTFCWKCLDWKEMKNIREDQKALRGNCKICNTPLVKSKNVKMVRR